MRSKSPNPTIKIEESDGPSPSAGIVGGGNTVGVGEGEVLLPPDDGTLVGGGAGVLVGAGTLVAVGGVSVAGGIGVSTGWTGVGVRVEPANAIFVSPGPKGMI